MVFYDPDFDMRFPDYGIMIPVLRSRARMVVDHLTRSADVSAMPGYGRIVEGLAGAAELLGINLEDLRIGRDDLERVHDRDYVARMHGDGAEGAAGLRNLLLLAYELLDAQGRPNRYEPEKAIFPLERLFGTVLGQVTGTYTACRLALEGGRIPGEREPGFCFFLGGGMHHARYDQGAGFCLVNDSIIAAARLQAEKRAARIWILDVDAHKGDGSAELAALMRRPLPERRGDPRQRGEREPRQPGDPLRQEPVRQESEPPKLESGAPAATGIFTLSAHMASGWPLDPESLRAAPRDRAPWVPSDVDVPIESGEEADYVPRLAAGIEEMERRFGKPDFAIVVDGADPYERDGLPSTASLALNLEQCLDRDKLLHGYLREKHIPSAWLMAGGYGEHAWEPPEYFLKWL